MPDPFRPDPPLVIGLRGGVASGKSAVAGLFAARGLLVVDADRLAREAVERPEVRDALAARFGKGVLAAGGGIRREELARLVFGDPQARKDLEAITHPVIREAILAQTAAAKASGQSVVWDVPLLLEGGLIERCDVVVFVEADVAVRQERACRRGWDEGELARREAAQAPLAVKKARAVFTILNDVPLTDTARQVDALLQDLGRRSGPSR